jgi:hypothetical protein
MDSAGICLTVVTAVLLFASPRAWAPLALLMSTIYIPMGQQILIGSLNFTATRVLIAVGVLRVMLKGERIAVGMTRLDWIMILLAGYAVFNSVFHQDPYAVLVYRLGLMYDVLGIFFLFRIFLQEPEDLRRLFAIISVLIVPVAICMIVEKLTGMNYFALFFGDVAGPEFRLNGSIRAHGPFAHAILAGTIGAACLPMALLLWRENRRLALTGLVAAAGIVFSSGASGPVMTTLAILLALALWTQRQNLRTIRWLVVILILALAIVMKAPVYYLIARIDVTGGSSSYYRAALIESAIKHLDEWWLAGTDYTRHWMPSGVPGNPSQADITNHYIAIGAMGGLPLLLLFIWVLFEAFSTVGRELRSSLSRDSVDDAFLIWTLGAVLFGHATAFLSISYFGQTFVFLYLLLASIGSLRAMWPVHDASSTAEDAEDQVIVPVSALHPAPPGQYEGAAHRYPIGLSEGRTGGGNFLETQAPPFAG